MKIKLTFLANKGDLILKLNISWLFLSKIKLFFNSSSSSSSNITYILLNNNSNIAYFWHNVFNK